MTVLFGDAAETYLEAGFGPLPLPAGKKSPPPAGFTGRNGKWPTQADVRRWLADPATASGNLGIRLPDNVIGLDVDAYDGKVGEATLKQLIARLGPLPGTPRVTARSEGDPASGIRFFRVPPGLAWISGLPGIDVIQHEHRYAVSSPSLHPSGEEYRWANDPITGGQGLPTGQVPRVDELPYLPDAWRLELELGTRAGQPVAPPEEAEDLLRNMPLGEPCQAVGRRLDELLQGLDSGGSRHDGMAKHVMALVRLGEQGHRGVPAAVEEARRGFLGCVAEDPSRGALSEFDRALRGAASKIAASPTYPGDRRCCGASSQSQEDGWKDDEDDRRIDPHTGELLPSPDLPDTNAPEESRTVESAVGGPDPLRLRPEFWASRPFLSAVRGFAWHRRVSPWALLFAALARACAAVPPWVVLPATIGSPASLNSFVALCGESGSKKSVITAVAEDFLNISGGVSFRTESPGSGEGLLAAYAYTHKEKGKDPELRQTNWSVLLTVDEIDALDRLMGRTNSTLLPFLKSAWSGAPIGTLNAESNRYRKLDRHRYRLAVVSGVQPENAGTILDDSAGGFPQRWLWVDTYNPDVASPQELAQAPTPSGFDWKVPIPGEPPHQNGSLVPGETITINLPGGAVEMILEADERRNRRIGTSQSSTESLDGHALLARAKVAGLFALLDGRTEINEEDWALSAVVMEVSDASRTAVIQARSASARREADRRAKRQGRSQAIADDTKVDEIVERIMRTIMKGLARLQANKNEQEWPKSTVKKLVRSHDRRHAPEAIARLVDSGALVTEERTVQNQPDPVTYYRLADGAQP